jgi:hypothetical protein
MEVLVNLSLNLQSPRFSTVGNRASLQPTSHWLISARPLVYKSSLLVFDFIYVLAGFTVHECRRKPPLLHPGRSQIIHNTPTPDQVKRKVELAPSSPACRDPRNALLFHTRAAPSRSSPCRESAGNPPPNGGDPRPNGTSLDRYQNGVADRRALLQKSKVFRGLEAMSPQDNIHLIQTRRLWVAPGEAWSLFRCLRCTTGRRSRVR